MNEDTALKDKSTSEHQEHQEHQEAQAAPERSGCGIASCLAKRWVKYVVLVLAVILVPLLYALNERSKSNTMYEASLVHLAEHGFPQSAKAYVTSEMAKRPALDSTRQERFWDLLENAGGWKPLKDHVSFQVEAPIVLSQTQQDWFDNPAHQSVAKQFATLFEQGGIDKSMYAWLSQRYPDLETGTMLNSNYDTIPSILGLSSYSTYLQLAVLQGAGLHTLLQWRDLNIHADNLIGSMSNMIALTIADDTLAYHVWQQSTDKLQLEIVPVDVAYKQALIGDRLVFAQEYFWMLQHNLWDDRWVVGETLWDRVKVSMWGLGDAAALNDYFISTCAVLDNTDPRQLKDIPLQTRTMLGMQGTLLIGLQSLYESNARQRLAQISIDLSNYYHQHGQLPADAAALQTLLPETYALLAGERFRFALTYSRPSASSYLVEVDTTYLPDSAETKKITAFPGASKHVFMIDSGYVFAQMQTK